MKVEILATGDEIRSGALIDSNSAYIATRLEKEGLEVTRHHCLGDDIDVLATSFREVARRADLALVTGGLGPTEDDLTTAAMAQAAGVELAVDEDALIAIEAYFARLKRFMPRSNCKQAEFPLGSEVLANPIGTAPGFCIKWQGCIFFCLPGVPREMRKMLTDEVLPRVRTLVGNHRQFSTIRTLSTFGSTESIIGEKLVDITAGFSDIKLGLRAKFPEIQVRLYGRGDDEDRLTDHMATVAGRVGERLGNIVFSQAGSPMAAVVGDLLIKNEATVAVAESCTGGLIAHLLTNVPGSSAFFLFSGVTYANEAKMNVLGVPEDTINAHGAVSTQTVKHMAAGARNIVNATYGLATSGIAGPDGGSDEKPVGTVCIGLTDAHKPAAQRFFFPFGGRTAKKKLFAMAALDTLRRHILGIEALDLSPKRH